MRNLKLLHSRSSKYDGIKADLIAQHAFNENITFVYDRNIVKSLNHVKNEVKELCSYEGVIAIEFVQLNDCLCFATSDGEIVQFNFTDNQFEVVGLISDGIETMRFSPDQELVVFVTKSANVILMFSTYDVLVESSLNKKAAKEFITVGWGKKETQFHGSVGKNVRTKKEINVDNVDELDKTVSCCWRGDGEFFAVNHVGANGRMFKVFDKEGQLQYTSEVCSDLQVPMAWKPSGLWIAKPEVYSNKYTITLFERNGLKHNELVLPFDVKDEQVVNLSWSQDSDIFLIETSRGPNIYCLYFYTICNYHWYMKHYIEFDAPVVSTWSQNYVEPKQFHLITSKGQYQTLKFDFVVNHSNGGSESDESVVAVIDGYKLLLTNFKSQMVPPPMASLEVSLKVPVNIVDFLHHPSEDFDTNSFFTLDFKNVCRIYRCVLKNVSNGQKLAEIEMVKEFSMSTSDNESYTNAVWVNARNIVMTKASTVTLCSIDSESAAFELPTEKAIGSISILSQNKIILQFIEGSLIELEVNDNDIIVTDTFFEKLPEFCEQIVGISINQEPLVYALKQIRKKLYLNAKELATEVTSFITTSENDHLIYTTIGELKFMEIGRNKMQVVESRKIERGSRIVSLVKDKSHVIFQLPRGNLESISPRILSFKIIKRHLKSSSYKLAFDLLRKERINLNLLIDLNPQKFLKESQDFVKQIDNVQWLNLFLTELKDEDVTTTMYKFCGSLEKDTEIVDEQFSMENKIAYLCEKMFHIFQELDARKYFLPSITCHVKTKKLESALQMIWDLKKAGSNDKEADDALKYLLYLIDINVLYNIALGMYDYQLVMFVVQKSQKDPKEYVPFLSELSNMPQAYARYKIDCHLKRYTKAVKHISDICHEEEKFEECIELTKKHSLYEAAMEAFADNPPRYRKMCVLFGDHLRVKGKLIDASLMYERGGDYQQALSGARNVLDWQRCVTLAKKSKFSEEEMKGMATKLSISLRDAGQYKDASYLVRRFQTDDLLTLVDILVSGRLYSEAIVELTMNGREELLEEILKPQLKQNLADAINSIETDREMYLEQKERLAIIRREKIKKIQNPQDDDDDMFSDTTSIQSSLNSRSSSKTFRSGKTKRKHERKLMNLKEGNKFEDVALVDSIWKLVHKIVNSENQKAIKELLKNAVELRIDEGAKALQKTFKDLLLLLKHTMDEIWVPEMITAGKYPETEEDMLQSNMDHSISSKMAYELIKPEQRCKPKMNVIDFEMEIFKESSKKS